jgi:hypothetical protein
MNAFKSFLKFILYAGAVVCCLAGLWVIYVAIVNFHEMPNAQWIVVLFIEAIFVCLSFTPAFMLFKGFKTKTWHWVVVGIIEATVIVIAFALLAFIGIMRGGE